MAQKHKIRHVECKDGFPMIWGKWRQTFAQNQYAHNILMHFRLLTHEQIHFRKNPENPKNMHMVEQFRLPVQKIKVLLKVTALKQWITVICDVVFRNQASGDYHYEQSLKIVTDLDFLTK